VGKSAARKCPEAPEKEANISDPSVTGTERWGTDGTPQQKDQHPDAIVVHLKFFADEATVTDEVYTALGTFGCIPNMCPHGNYKLYQAASGQWQLSISRKWMHRIVPALWNLEYSEINFAPAEQETVEDYLYQIFEHAKKIGASISDACVECYRKAMDEHGSANIVRPGSKGIDIVLSGVQCRREHDPLKDGEEAIFIAYDLQPGEHAVLSNRGVRDLVEAYKRHCFEYGYQCHWDYRYWELLRELADPLDPPTFTRWGFEITDSNTPRHPDNPRLVLDQEAYEADCKFFNGRTFE
jgi:hypothetical protein